MQQLPVNYIESCSHCGYSVGFAGMYSYFAVCPNCRHTVYRSGSDVKEVVKHHITPEDFSLLKIGTRGTYNGDEFVVIGRLRLQLDNGYLNLWHLFYPKIQAPKYNFIAEGMTDYAMVNLGIRKAAAHANYDRVVPGKPFGYKTCEDVVYSAMTISTCKYSTVDGELPNLPAHFDYSNVFELRNDNKGAGYYICYAKKDVYTFEGEWVGFDALKLQNLRVDIKQKQLMQAMAGPLQLDCPTCNTTLTILGRGQSGYVVCNNCKTYNSIGYSSLRKQGQVNHNAEYPAVFKIGDTGVIDGAEFTVLGYTLKYAQQDQAYWQEYYLFSPVEGFLFLSVYQGNWIKLTTVSDYQLQVNTKSEVGYKGVTYSVFNVFECRVADALGEFPHDIFATKKIKSAEYINPPSMVSVEQTHESYRWFVGKHITASEIKRAFPNAQMPVKIGIGMIEPGDELLKVNSIYVTVAMSIVLFALQFLLFSAAKNTTVFEESYTCTDSLNNKQYVTPSFYLDGNVKNVGYGLYADVSNTWFETSVVLVNDVTDESYEFTKGVEYYFGYSDGESWSEGTRVDEWTIPSVKGGKYHLIVTPTKAPSTIDVQYKITVKRDIPTYNNFYWLAAFILIVPLAGMFTAHMRNRQRWSNSSFNPYNTDY